MADMTAQQLWTKFEEQNLPPLVLSGISSNNELLFSEQDLLPATKIMSKDEAAKLAAERAKVCAPLPWWRCTAADTNGTCGFEGGKCVGAPVENYQNPSYLEKWLRIYTPIYGPMGPPNLTKRAEPTAKPSSARSRRRSVTRDVFI